MYPSSTSSSSQGSMGPNGGGSNNNNNTSGLIRYGSAPSSLLAAAVESAINPSREFSSLGSHHLHMGPTTSRFFPSSETSSITSESTCKTSNNHPREKGPNTNSGSQRAYGLKLEGTGGGGGGAGMVSSSSPLVRHSSLPAGFLNQLAHACTSPEDNGALIFLNLFIFSCLDEIMFLPFKH